MSSPLIVPRELNISGVYRVPAASMKGLVTGQDGTKDVKLVYDGAHTHHTHPCVCSFAPTQIPPNDGCWNQWCGRDPGAYLPPPNVTTPGFYRPNGIAFSPDGTKLLVGESAANAVG